MIESCYREGVLNHQERNHLHHVADQKIPAAIELRASCHRSTVLRVLGGRGTRTDLQQHSVLVRCQWTEQRSRQDGDL